MCHYKHLTLFEREKILFLFLLGNSMTTIAINLGRSTSTISRELRRNAYHHGYLPLKAQEKYQQRRKACHPHKILENPELQKKIQYLFLKHQWSPEEIANRLTMEHHKKIISYTTIYRAIYAGMLDTSPRTSHNSRGAARKLRHRGKSRHTANYQERRGKFPISLDISQRPIGATHRSRRGHWEADTVVGKKGKACLVTLVDRKSRYLVGGKATKKNARFVNEVISRSLKGQPLHSITPDRGKEFAKYPELTKRLHVKCYFPQPHQPWQRGTNENTNGLLREYFPKGRDITNIPESVIQEKYRELNLRPRKCLGYKTPYEVYFSKTLHLT